MEEELLAAITAEPDAIEPRLIYADWLQSRNDPRGELIVVQHERRSTPDNAELKAREAELVEALSATLVPERVPREVIGRWELGFVDELILRPRSARTIRGWHAGWLQHPAMRLVRTLDVHSRFARTLRIVRETPLARSVRHLRFGNLEQALEPPTLAAISNELPAITSLTLRCLRTPELDVLAALALATFEIELGRLDAEALQHLMLPPPTWSLATLCLRGAYVYQGEVFAELRALFAGKVHPSVRHLELGAPFPGVTDMLEALAASGRLATLDTLGLPFQQIAHEDSPRIGRHRDALARVKLIPARSLTPYYDTQSRARLASLLTHQLERSAEAIPLFEEVLRATPYDAWAHYGHGTALRGAGRHEASLAAIDTAIEKVGKSVPVVFLDGRHFTLCELGRRDEAIAELERAVEIDPSFANGWNNLGCERQFRGDSAGAFAAYARAIELVPTHTYARRNQGELMLELQRPGEALPIFERLAAEQPQEPRVLALRAQALIQQGRFDEARLLLDARLRTPATPWRNDALILRAVALHLQRAEVELSGRDLDAVVRETALPSWIALVWLVESLRDPARWAKAVPATAIAPFELGDAVADHARRARPADAIALRALDNLERLDCSEIAILAALLAGERPLARARARAMVAFYESLGPSFHRPWWHTLSGVAWCAGRRLHDTDRELIRTVETVTRRRRPRAELDAIAKY